MGPGQMLEEHYQENVSYYTHVIEADPEDAQSYFLRARYHHYLHNKEKYIADMNEYVGLLYPAEGTNPHNRWFRDMLNGLWRSTPTVLGAPVNSPKHDFGCMSVDGLSIYLQTIRPGGYGWFGVRHPPSLGVPRRMSDHQSTLDHTKACRVSLVTAYRSFLALACPRFTTYRCRRAKQQKIHGACQ